jgi:hypothetical protein
MDSTRIVIKLTYLGSIIWNQNKLIDFIIKDSSYKRTVDQHNINAAASGQHVRFVVDKASLGRFSPSTSVSLPIIISPWAGTIDLLLAAVPSGPNWTPPPTKPIKKKWGG